jgi:excisionase family DNA binding protein
MAQEKLLTIRDVASILGISEKEVINLSESGAIPAYKIGGVYIRFKRHQIDEFKKSNQKSYRKNEGESYSFNDKLKDFFYFNDFYILSAILVIVIIIFIFKGK